MKFDEYCNRLRFFADVNGDGQVTITDVIAWVKFLFFAPAQIAMAIVDEMPALSRFFESDCETGLSGGGAVFSLIVWLFFALFTWALIYGSMVSAKGTR